MYNILKNWHFMGLNDKFLKIGKGRQSFSSSYFEDQDQFAQLCRYCRDHFGRPIQIKILENSALPPHVNQGENQDPDHSSASPKEAYSEPVRDVIRIFQGEVKEEKTR
jgi:hypothetical protein